MQALVFDTPGKAQDVLQMQEIAVPEPGPGQVLVQLEARPIQPADLMFIGGRYRIKPVFPQTAGLEGSGRVVAVGPGATSTLGTRVAFRHPGTWAEFASVPAAKTYRVPESVAAESACQFSLNPLTAWALLDEANLKEGDWFAVNAATSGIARLVHALARRKGLNMVGIVRGAADHSLPFPTVSASAEDLAGAILEITGGRSIAALLDCVGGQSVTRVFPAMGQGATVVSYGVMETAPATVGNADMIYRNLTWKGFGIDFWLSRAGERFEVAVADLWQAIAEGNLDLPVKARYPLHQFTAALDAMSAHPHTGKVLLTND